MGRKKIANLKSEIIFVRVDRKMKIDLEDVSKKKKQSVPATVRESITNLIQKYGRK